MHLAVFDKSLVGLRSSAANLQDLYNYRAIFEFARQVRPSALEDASKGRDSDFTVFEI
jgi:hypothetical protein